MPETNNELNSGPGWFIGPLTDEEYAEMMWEDRVREEAAMESWGEHETIGYTDDF